VRDNQRNYVVVGVFVLAMIAGLVAALALLSGRTGATDLYYTAFDNVTGVEPGTRVLFEGYPIGQIERVRPAGPGQSPRYRVEMSVVDGWRIPVDSRAQITAPGLLAALTIDIHAGESPEALSPGGTVPGVEAGNVLAAVSTVAGNVNDLTQNVLRPLVETIGQRAPVILANLEELSAQLAQAGQRVNQVLSAENRDEFRHILANLQDASAAVKGLAHDVSGVLAKVDGLVTENRANVDQALLGLSHSLQAVARHIDAVTQDLEGTTRNMSEFSRRIRHDPGLLIRGGAGGADEGDGVSP
jgi:phospholipid/cholesterol/gamma-HCH transport system substrate-binding protein